MRSLQVLGGLVVLSMSVAALDARDGSQPLRQAELLRDEILQRGEAFETLRGFLSGGPRLCGSAAEKRAATWVRDWMTKQGFENVRLQRFESPHWTRGEQERGWIVRPGAAPEPLRLAALGGSGGTPGLEAEVVEVQSLDEARRRAGEVRGKWIFFNRAMVLPASGDAFEAYGRAADQRMSGPALAQRLGAAGALVRSLTTLPDDDHPHTGVTGLRAGSAIPAAALSTRSANALSRALKQGGARVRVELSAKWEAPSFAQNVIGEIRGEVTPQEVVVLGGHLDSWDLSEGAHDNGAGVARSLEVLRAMKKLGIRPARTVRAVIFGCEEMGGVGGEAYAAGIPAGERTVLAVESDRGGFMPTGFEVDERAGLMAGLLKEWREVLAPTGASHFEAGGSGTDTEPLTQLGVPGLGLVNESAHYFDVHHTDDDRLEHVASSELNAGAAAMAVVVYLAGVR